MKKNILIIILIILLSIATYFIASKYFPTIVPNNILSTQTTLDLSGKGLTKVPDYVFKQTNLEVLNLSNNSLTGAIPGEIRFLTKLTSLDLSNNLLTGVPAEVGQLSNLTTLNLSNNQLTGLPYELANLKKLQVLDISGNSYSQQDLAVITEGLPSTVQIIK